MNLIRAIKILNYGHALSIRLGNFFLLDSTQSYNRIVAK